ncbi:MAG: metal ABC transporter ATP-binding protein [Veillonellaceae bacterium]|nr:metal ABC transporter ATP-binding protein [Veillonellaceae bacterium]
MTVQITEPLLTADELTYRYGRETVFADISFTVARGAFAVIVGPNGAGKTTLLRLLAGLAEPAVGTISIAGRSVAAAQKAGIIGFVSQQYSKNTAAFPATAAEVVALGLIGRGCSRRERAERVADILATVGMGDAANTRIGDLSGGQQQRIFVAQALVKEPAILLLDEPTSGIDYRSGAELLELLADRCRTGTTIVLVSHDLTRALEPATQVLCLQRELCYNGTPAGFFAEHGGEFAVRHWEV